LKIDEGERVRDPSCRHKMGERGSGLYLPTTYQFTLAK